MFQILRNAWKIQDLRKKILFTIMILLIFRIGSAITVPFVDAELVRNAANGFTATYQIVGTTEADPRKGKISNESPIGAALLGRKAGEKVDVHTPGGLLELEIVRINA